MGTFDYIGHNGTWSCACDASKQEAISSGTSQTAALPLSQMCHSVVDVTTVPGPLSDYPTVYADSEKLKRLSGRFGCVWLSLISLPCTASPDCTPPSSSAQGVGVSSQSHAKQITQHHCVCGHYTVPYQHPSSLTLPTRSPCLSSSKERKSNGAEGTPVHCGPLSSPGVKTRDNKGLQPARALFKERMNVTKRNLLLGMCQFSGPYIHLGDKLFG
jgi:hypothetical protein